MTIYVPGKLVLAKEFVVQDYMWNFPQEYGVWSPASITTALWLDAADANTITESGGAVSQWNDKSGNGRNATATSTARPAYSATSFNNKPGLTFDGTANVMQANTLAIIAQGSDQPWSAMFVGRLTSGSTSRITLGFGSITGGHRHYIGLSNTNVFNTVRRDGGYTQVAVNGTSAVSSNNVFGMVFGGTTATLYQNGTQDATGALDVGSMSSGLSTFTIGAGFAGSAAASGFTNCVLSEIIVVSSSIATDTRQRIEGYLAHKWGLTANLPNDHPYKTVRPTP